LMVLLVAHFPPSDYVGTNCTWSQFFSFLIVCITYIELTFQRKVVHPKIRSNFRRKNWRFSQNQCYDHNFAVV
jgi:hypothetical protein